MKFETVTSPGGRSVNEDSLKIVSQDNRYAFIVCDGLGGHGLGDIASSEVCRVFEEEFFKTKSSDEYLKNAFEKSNEHLLNVQEEQNCEDKMKTTCVVLVTDKDTGTVSIAHVGDSRCYVFSHNKVKTRTIDHSIPQLLVLTKELKEKDIRFHPQRNMVLRALGVREGRHDYEKMPDMPLKKCQAFLICTDGFWELIDEKEMSKLLKESSSPSEWLSKMTQAIEEAGDKEKMDNYSAIAVWNE